MKTLSILLLFLYSFSFAQETLTIEEAYTMAKQNYPLIKRNNLIEKTRQFNTENASKAWLPQIQVVGQATYQNEVTRLPFSLPNMTIEPLSKDQYKVYADVQQTIYDGGMIANQKKIADVTAGIEKQKIEVELDKLEERINQLYFGILQTDEQIQQTKLTEKDIQNGLSKAEAQLRNGVILRSQMDVLRAQLILLEQKQIELETVRKNFLDLLSVFINKKLNANTALQRPKKIEFTKENNRTELQLFQLQQQAVEVQKSLLHSKNLPKLGAFFQGGYGKPGFNMLKNEFDLFYIAGIRLNIPISGYYTQKNDLGLLTIQQEEIEVQKENFLFNQQFQTLQSSNELEKIQNLIDKDAQLIVLRERILRASLAQLENGVINTNDYLREVHELDRAKNQKIIHEIQFLLTQYNLRAQLNN
ncbi:MAG: TolC family protein [Weeksellaceae bacterium]|nr:TolC family protein [Weeksellaceae bacterium]